MMESLTIHHMAEKGADTSLPDTHQDVFSRNTQGFWIYLMTDCILFATLFVTHAVLVNSTFGGPNIRDLVELKSPFCETMVLLSSSLTCGCGVLAAVRNKRNQLLLWLLATLLLGATFITLEVTEFAHLAAEGSSWQRSASLSSYFALVGTHGLHVTVGILWATILVGQLLFHGLTTDTFRRAIIFSFFWHFLELIWIFVVTIVYLVGSL